MFRSVGWSSVLCFLLVSVVFLSPFVSASTARVDGPPLSVAINGVEFSRGSRELRVSVNVSNNFDLFADNLKYILILYEGDRLVYNGWVFSNLSYVLSCRGGVEPLAPRDSVKLAVSCVLPENIDSANYFVDLQFSDDEGVFFGRDFTTEPVALAGTGGFVGVSLFYVRTSHGDDFPMFGWELKPDESLSVVIPLRRNPGLSRFVESGGVLYSEARVYGVSLSDRFVAEYPRERFSVRDDEIGRVLVREFKPWKGIEGGPYTLVLNLSDEGGKVVGEPLAGRWLVEGFTARVREIKASEGFYGKGSSLGVNVSLVVWSAGERRSGVVELSLRERGTGVEFNLSREVSLALPSNQTLLDVGFLDYVFPRDVALESVRAVLRDRDSGVVLDEKEVTLKFVPTTLEVVPPVARPFGKGVYAVSAVVVLVLLAFAFFRLKGKRR